MSLLIKKESLYKRWRVTKSLCNNPRMHYHYIHGVFNPKRNPPESQIVGLLNDFKVK